MNTVDKEVQQLFAKYEGRNQQKNEEEILSEIHALHHAWDAFDWSWEDHDFELKYKRSIYLKKWEQVQNKLAMKIETASDGDYWWTPPQHQETVNLLWELTALLRKAASPWWRHIGTVSWHVMRTSEARHHSGFAAFQSLHLRNKSDRAPCSDIQRRGFRKRIVGLGFERYSGGHRR